MTFFKFIIFNVSFQILKWFLQRLEKAVASFTDSVRPVCLAVPDFIDYPTCPDVSLVVDLLLSNKIMRFSQTFYTAALVSKRHSFLKKKVFPKGDQVAPSQMSNFPSDTFPNVRFFSQRHFPVLPELPFRVAAGYNGGPSAAARTDLGSCRLGKCLWYRTF